MEANKLTPKDVRALRERADYAKRCGGNPFILPDDLLALLDAAEERDRLREAAVELLRLARRLTENIWFGAAIASEHEQARKIIDKHAALEGGK